MRFIQHLNNSCYSVPGKNNITPDNPIVPDDPVIPDEPITPDSPDNNYAWVDLGLPSGLLWATNNVGAVSETDYGDYFSWGNITGHKSTNGSTFDDSYDFGSANSGPYASTPGAALSGDIPANATYDAAQANMGGDWRMPTKNEFQELYDNTDSEKTTINGVSGWKLMKKSDHSVYVFFPAAGEGSGTSVNGRGSYGSYWSSSFSSADRGYYSGFFGGIVYPQSLYYRYNGYSVRAVLDNVLL